MCMAGRRAEEVSFMALQAVCSSHWLAGIFPSLWLTNRFYVALGLCYNRSQKKSI